MAAVEIPSTAINIPNAGVPSSLFATKRKRGRPQKKKISGTNIIENLDDLLSSSPDSKEPKLSLDVEQRRIEDFLPVAPLSQDKCATPSVEASTSSTSSPPSSSTNVSTPSSAPLETQKNLSDTENGSKSGDSCTEEQPKAPLSPKQRKKKAKAKAKAKAKKAVTTTVAQQQQQRQDDSQLAKEVKQEAAAGSSVVPPQPKVASPPVGVLKQTNKEPAAASAASEKSNENASPIPNIQWKIKLSIVEGIRKYVVEKQALPCFERPSILNCAKLPQLKEVEGQWFIVRQDRSFSKPLPAQLENIAKTRETRQTNQKSYSKSRPPPMPKKGQLIIECSVSGNQSTDDVQPEQLTYVRNIAFDSGITTTGAKTNLHLHCPAADNGAQDIVIVGAKSGCVNAISLFIPSSDLTPSWQRLLKSHSAADEEEYNDEESSSPLMKKRREDQSTDSGQSTSSAGKEQDSPLQKRRKVVWAEDVNVRYYIGPASTKKFTKKHKNLQLDRCADVKIKCSDKVAKKKGTNYKFHQLELQAIPGIAGSPPASPPLKSARTGSPPPPSTVETVSSNSNEDEEVNIVDDDVNTDSSVKADEKEVTQKDASIEPATSESSQDSTEMKPATDERRQEKAIDECSMTEGKTEESSLS